NLLELVLKRSYEYTIKFFTIKAPSLQRLNIDDCNDGDEFVGYVIDVLSLKFLEIVDIRCPQFSMNASELVEANIRRFSNVISESLASVRRLVMNVSPSKVTFYIST